MPVTVGMSMSGLTLSIRPEAAMVEQVIAKAGVLIEALPYIQRFRGESIVVKFGGSAMEEQAHHDSILADVAFMEVVGMRPVVVHGGGKAISRRLKSSGIEPRFIDGLRVTDGQTVAVVEDVLTNEVNPRIVAELEQNGAQARLIRGTDVFRVRKRVETDAETGVQTDWGFVGQVTDVDVSPIVQCFEEDVIPVVTPVGADDAGQSYNINADLAAVAVAKALKARKLAFLSDIPGLLHDLADPDSLISTVSISDVASLIERGVIAGGMLPKVASGVEALEAGVRKIHIIDGRLSHSLLLEIFTDEGIGTEIVHDK